MVEAFKLANSSDSISYTAGMSSTMGLVSFLLQQKVDTAYMADFVRGFNETVTRNLDNPQEKAYMMGTTIAQQLIDRMLPSVKKELEGTADSLVSSVFFKGFADAVKTAKLRIVPYKGTERLTDFRVQIIMIRVQCASPFP